jgi:hypothetical protein
MQLSLIFKAKMNQTGHSVVLDCANIFGEPSCSTVKNDGRVPNEKEKCSGDDSDGAKEYYSERSSVSDSSDCNESSDGNDISDAIESSDANESSDRNEISDGNESSDDNDCRDNIFLEDRSEEVGASL